MELKFIRNYFYISRAEKIILLENDESEKKSSGKVGLFLDRESGKHYFLPSTTTVLKQLNNETLNIWNQKTFIDELYKLLLSLQLKNNNNLNLLDKEVIQIFDQIRNKKRTNISEKSVNIGKIIHKIIEIILKDKNKFFEIIEILNLKKEEKKEILNKYYEKIIKEELNYDLKNENICINKLIVDNEDILNIYNCLYAFSKYLSQLINKNKENTDFKIIDNELLLYYLDLNNENRKGFYGNIDLVFKYNDYYYIVDFKTSKKIYDEYFIQLASYKFLYCNLHKNINQEDVKLVVVKLEKQTGDFKYKELEEEKYKEFLDIFFSLNNIWHFKWKLNFKNDDLFLEKKLKENHIYNNRYI